MRKLLVLMLSGTLTGLVSQAVSAHGIWITNRVDQKQIVLGEGPLDNGYQPECVKQLNHLYRH